VIFVDFVSDAGFEGNRGKLRGAGEGHLDGNFAVLFQKRKFVSGKRTKLAELSIDHAIDVTDRGGFHCAGIPTAGNRIAVVEPLDGLIEITHEIAAAEFSVGSDFKAKLLLFREHALNVLVLKLVQVRRALRIFRRLSTRFQQLRRAQKTSNVISAKWSWHLSLLITWLARVAVWHRGNGQFGRGSLGRCRDSGGRIPNQTVLKLPFSGGIKDFFA